jgi:hypothetical protein
MISIDVTSASAYSAENGSALIEMCAIASIGGRASASKPSTETDAGRDAVPASNCA